MHRAGVVKKDGKPVAHPVADQRVRRAMLLALDVDAVIRDVPPSDTSGSIPP